MATRDYHSMIEVKKRGRDIGRLIKEACQNLERISVVSMHVIDTNTSSLDVLT